MAVTWSAAIVSATIAGGRKRVVADLTTSGSGNTYTTGGDAHPGLGAFGFRRFLEHMNIMGAIDGFIYKWDKANSKIVVYNDNSAASYTQNVQLGELAAATALNSKTLRVEAIGF